MSKLRSAWEKYLSRRAVDGPWRLEGDTSGPFAGVVVIPALAESASLFATLDSLATNPPEYLERWQIVVVVNHCARADEEQKIDNRRTLERLRRQARTAPMRLAWIEAAGPGLELPSKQAGVGLARKIGFDLALAGLDPLQRSALVALDADTLVDSTYLPAIEKHFAGNDKGGAVLPFQHWCDGPFEARSAIETYELYLRAYPFGLHLAGSPYAYPTLGSAMACTAEAYVRAGGMSRRPAGEDFYFLQQLAKTSGVEQLYGTVVRPSARLSARTPFGTGPSMHRLTGGDEGVVAFHDPRIFEILGRWLRLAGCTPKGEAGEILSRAGHIHPTLAAFLLRADFEAAWTRLKDNGRGVVNPERFHDWFDGLKTFRLVRHLSQHDFPPGEPSAMVAPLLQRTGLPGRGTVSQLNRRLSTFWGADGAKRVV